MRLLMTIAEMGTGGAERVVAELAAIALERGDEVCLAADSGPLDELVPAGVERVLTPTRGSSPVALARGVRSLSTAIAGFEPDLVHAHNVRATAAAALADRLRRGPRTPLLATFHGVPSGSYTTAARLLRAADAVACVSAELVRSLEAAGLPAGRATVVHNAVPPAEPLSGEARAALDAELGLTGAPVVSVVGRLVPQKAHSRFIEAAALLASRERSVRFLIVGDGPLRAELEAQAERAGLSDRLVFTGVRSDARALIARSELLAFSSDWEGLSIAALEALAAGVPVVSTPAHGMSELLRDGAGVVVDEFSAKALADAIGELLADPERRRRMGVVGRELIAREYSLARMGRDYGALWERLTAGVS